MEERGRGSQRGWRREGEGPPPPTLHCFTVKAVNGRGNKGGREQGKEKGREEAREEGIERERGRERTLEAA